MTLIILLALWELYWTYHACWLAAQRNEKNGSCSFSCSTCWGSLKSSTCKKRSWRRCERHLLTAMNTLQRYDSLQRVETTQDYT